MSVVNVGLYAIVNRDHQLVKVTKCIVMQVGLESKLFYFPNLIRFDQKLSIYSSAESQIVFDFNKLPCPLLENNHKWISGVHT